MIDTRELMRGNWLEINIGSLYNPCQVTLISEEFVEVKYGVGKVSLTYTAFNPIPITEQWLRDFGFEADSEGNFEKSRVKLDYYTLAKVDWVVHLSPFLLHLKYVHQLQNLFYQLSGEELVLNKKVNA